MPDQEGTEKVHGLIRRLVAIRNGDHGGDRDDTRTRDHVLGDVRVPDVLSDVRESERVLELAGGPRTVPLAQETQRRPDRDRVSCVVTSVLAPDSRGIISPRRGDRIENDVSRTVVLFDGDVCHCRHALFP